MTADMRSFGKIWIVRHLVFALAIAFCPGAARAQDDVVFRDVRVFDGQDVLTHATVVVQDGLIAAVLDAAAAGAADVWPQDALIIDGQGHTLMPGFIDAHTHTSERRDLVSALAHGVITHLDMFGRPEFALALREESAADAVDRADMFGAGIVATAPGGHGTQYGWDIPTLSEPGQADGFVAARVTERSDWIKIIIEDGAVLGADTPSLDSATVAALVAAAHRRGLPAIAHISTVSGARLAVAAGVDGLAHGWIDDADDAALITALQRRNVFVIPTLTVYANRGARVVERLARAGVTILVGSDADNPGTAFGLTVHRELRTLVEAGLTPRAALVAATSATADAFGLNDRGRIRPGQRADLVLVTGDPTTDITATTDVVGVWKAGVRFDAASYVADVDGYGPAADEDAPAHGPGMVSDFDDGTTAAAIGASWIASSDRRRGGQSTARIEVVPGGPTPGGSALRVTGEVVQPTLRLAWAGALLPAGDTPGTVMNLAAAAGIAFFARGDGRTYEVTVYTSDGPAVRPFTPAAEWAEFRLAWSEFDDLDPSAIVGISIDASLPVGSFELFVDRIRLW